MHPSISRLVGILFVFAWSASLAIDAIADETTAWSYQIAERGASRMITDGHWKLVRTYPYDSPMRPIDPPVDRWYVLSHPMGEIRATEPPREALRAKMVRALEDYFAMYEDPKFSGRKIWDQPPPNGRVKAEIERDKKDNLP